MKPLDSNTGARPEQPEDSNAAAPNRAAQDSRALVPRTTPQSRGTSSLPAQVSTEPAPSAPAQEPGHAPIFVPPATIPLAWLGVVAGPGAIRGHTFVLRPDNLIGRSKGDILLGGDATISSQHAQIKLEQGQGSAPVFVLYDLNSTNGTRVGTLETVASETSRIQRREMHSGDYMVIGKTLLVFLQA